MVRLNNEGSTSKVNSKVSHSSDDSQTFKLCDLSNKFLLALAS